MMKTFAERMGRLNDAFGRFDRTLTEDGKLRFNTARTGEIFINLSECDVSGSLGTIVLQSYDAGAKKWRDMCLSMGACPSCIDGAFEPYGCTDCFNTGWATGDPYQQRDAAIAELAALKAKP